MQDGLCQRPIGDLISNNLALSPSPINLSTLIGFWYGQDIFVLHKAQLLCRDSLMGLGHEQDNRLEGPKASYINYLFSASIPCHISFISPVPLIQSVPPVFVT